MRGRLFPAFLLLFLFANGAAAGLVDCKAPQGASYIVFLSEPQFDPGAFRDRGAMLAFFNRLHEHLDERRDLEMAGIEAGDFRVARCENRVPSIDGSDFTDDQVRSLHGRGVVVEIWGRLRREPDAKKQPRPAAQMNYLLVPIRRGVIKGSEKLPGMLRFNYPDRQIVATDFIDLVSNADLHAFVASAVGVSAFDNGDFALAHRMLCRASGQLRRTAERLAAEAASKPQAERVRELNGFLLQVAGEALLAGRSAQPPRQFAVLQDPKNPCPGP